MKKIVLQITGAARTDNSRINKVFLRPNRKFCGDAFSFQAFACSFNNLATAYDDL
jgi:hypothetical protein